MSEIESAIRDFLRGRRDGQSGRGEPRLVPIAGDGSTRRFFRVAIEGDPAILVVNPLPPDRLHPDENENDAAVRAFLEGRGVRVARLLRADLDRGLLLLEDLGEERLFERARKVGWEDEKGREELLGLYRIALRVLIRMQEPGDPAFDPGSVSNPPYTAAFALENEARYFHEECARGRFGIAERFEDLEAEYRGVIGQAFDPRTPPGFLHRDYQSRNLMVAGGGRAELAVIDLQGGRLGPPEYDLASLLYDPYVRMPGKLRDLLREEYLAMRGAGGGEAWSRQFLCAAAARLLQALGAFSKLGGRLGRPGFLEHIPAGLVDLERILGELGCAPRLRALVGSLGRRAGR